MLSPVSPSAGFWKGGEEYEVVKTIGEGAFGKVKLAVHRVIGEKVALKSLSKPTLSTHPGTTERVFREILLTSHLRHPHIVPLLQVIDTPTDIHLVLEYQPGGDLFERVEKSEGGKMVEVEARRVMRQVVEGVQYGHACGVAHRDLKPENLLIDENDNIKINDYGFANVIRDDNMMETFCGSPAYAAPGTVTPPSPIFHSLTA
ncbi:Protein kinase [Borealophlyctis nickersoniae]|nr:Protein kinase [Borealophlyctis nickersoniae]